MRVYPKTVSVCVLYCVLTGSVYGQDLESSTQFIQVVQPSNSGEVRANGNCSVPRKLKETMKPINQIELKIRRDQADLPDDCFAEHFPHAADLSLSSNAPRSEHEFQFAWSASGLVHNPLYFEDVPLERYGHGYSPLVQPVVSTGKFFGGVFTLPYRMGVDSPHDLQSTLGYERPGNCAPSVKEHLPLSAKGAVLQGGAIVGGIYLFP